MICSFRFGLNWTLDIREKMALSAPDIQTNIKYKLLFHQSIHIENSPWKQYFPYIETGVKK